MRKDETKGMHLATGLVSSQAQGMSIGGKSGRGAGVARLGAGAQGDGEVESEVHCVAHLLDNWHILWRAWRECMKEFQN